MDSLEEINSKMDTIEYGWVDSSNNKHVDMKNYSDSYVLQSPENLLRSRLGVCWDQVELERKLFNDNGIKNRSFFIVYYDNDKCPTHTFILLEHSNEVYWYEHAWATMRGLHRFDSFEQAILSVYNTFIDKELHGKYNPQNLIIYEYETPPYGISCSDFYKHCEKGKRVQAPRNQSLVKTELGI